MKTKILIQSLFTVSMFFISINLNSQSIAYSWAFDIGEDDFSEDVFDIHFDSQNNIYLVASIEHPTDIDPGAGTQILHFSGTEYEPNFILVKYTATGQLLWGNIISCAYVSGEANDFDNESFKIITDENSNVYVVGNYRGTIDFDPSSEQFLLDNPTDYYRFFIAKYDATGSFVDAKTVDGSALLEIYYQTLSIGIKNNGNLIISGSFKDSIIFDATQPQYSFESESWNVFIAEYTNDLDFLQAKKIDAYKTNSCKIDHNNNIYLGGYFSGDADFDPSSSNYVVSSTNAFDPYMAKYDENGNFLWVLTPSASTGDDLSYCIAVDSAGNSYLSGTFEGSISFNGVSNNYIFNATGSTNSFIIKSNNNGEILSAKEINGVYNSIKDIEVDDSLNVFAFGNFTSSIIFNGNTVNSMGNSPDIFIAKFNNTLHLVDYYTIGGDYQENTIAVDIDKANNIICTGEFSETVDFDPSSNVANLVSPYPSYPGLFNNIFIAKYINSEFVGINDEFDKNINLQIYPNPASTEINLSLPNNETIESIKIYNQNGQLLKQIIKPNAEKINVSDLKTGLYFIRTDTDTNRYLSKMIKE